MLLMLLMRVRMSLMLLRALHKKLLNLLKTQPLRLRIPSALNKERTALESLLGLVDMVLVMSVHPGFGGQSFIESSPAKIAAIVEMCKAEGAAPLIEVDGGIGAATAPLVSAVGADVLVAGSAIFCADDPAAALRGIRDACR